MVTSREMNQVWKPPKQNLTLEEFKEDICLYVKLYDWVSIAEMKRRYGSQAQGEYALTLPHSPNILLFSGVSELFCKALSDVIAEKRIHPHGSSTLTYLIDGEILRLPLAKRKPARGDYKTPHWLPVTFRNGECCFMKGCPNYVRPSTVKRQG